MAKKETSKTAPVRRAARGAAVDGAEAPSKKGAPRQNTAATVAAKREATAPSTRPQAKRAVARDMAEPQLGAVLEELRGVKRLVEQLATPPSESDAGLDGTVDSMRRLLSEFIEHRMESVIRDLVDIRREAASLAADDSQRIVARLEELLERLGAERFEAEPLEVVDPLIHVVVDERQQSNAPEGVILETVRPGYRTARGLVVAKAAVAVNQRP